VSTEMAYVGLSQHINFPSLKSPTERFELQHLIGEGTYGEVYSALDKVTGKKVAIKILEQITENLEEIEEEYLVLSELSRHPNLPEFHGLFLKKGKTPEEDQIWFCLELMHGGSITDLGKKSCQSLLSQFLNFHFILSPSQFMN
jgi:myosin III